MSLLEGNQTIAPYFIVSGADRLIEFLVGELDLTIIIVNRRSRTGVLWCAKQEPPHASGRGLRCTREYRYFED